MITLARNAKFRLLLSIRHAVIVHLERTNHTTHVMRMNNGSRVRIALDKQGMQCLLANTLGKLLISCAAIILEFSRWKVHLIECSLEIQARTAAKDRKAFLSKHALNMSSGVRLVERGRIRNARINDIDKTQRRRALLRHHLGRTDIHATIDLHRIARQHFGRKASSQTICNIALANRRRTDNRYSRKTCTGGNH